jgi:dipeptidyl aminopeptidase/acylaminoacyl peptidase
MRRARMIGFVATLGAALIAMGGSASAGRLPAPRPCVVDQPSESRLAYVSDLTSVHPTAWAAQPDGSHPVPLGSGTYSATISPDGISVAIVTPESGSGSALVVVPSDGGRFKTLFETGRNGSIDQVTWSDSGWLAAVVDDRQLVVLDPARHVKRTIARAHAIEGVSFMPGGCSDRLVYGRLASGAPDSSADLYAATLDGKHTQRLTHDGHSAFPVWGPLSIAYAGKLPSGPTTTQLQLIDPDGRHARRLTHVKGPGILTPTAWSIDGKHLLAEQFHRDGSDAWTVQVPNGAARDLTGKVDDVIGAGLSRDGRTVLVQQGAEDDPGHQSVATIPWRGGAAHVLVAHGGSPSWNR